MTRWGVLVLPGSSGRDESARAAALEPLGVVAASYRWFGRPGQVPGICEVPVESFGPALDELAARVDQVAVLGTSKGAEAALLLGVHHPRVDAVVAISPPAHVWASVGPGADGRELPRRSSFTLDGAPLPFVGYDPSGEATDSEPPALRGMPGEPPRPTGALRAGGSSEADARAGVRLRDAMVRVLNP